MQGMRIRSVNVGAAEELRRGDRQVVTGIVKRPVEGSIGITSAGMAGDVICDTENHGGVDQAIYVYSCSDYVWWSSELGKPLLPGTFGENLAIDGLPDDLHAGDRLLIGDAVLEATSPRIPCATLGIAMGDTGFGLRFRYAERPGFYCRVLNPGDVAAGDAVTLVEDPSSQVTMLDQFRARYEPAADTETLERLLSAPIALRMREMFEARLAAMPADQGTAQ